MVYLSESKTFDSAFMGTHGEENIDGVSELARKLCNVKIASNFSATIDTTINDIKKQPTSSSFHRHTKITPETLADNWGISIKQAKETLKVTTQWG